MIEVLVWLLVSIPTDYRAGGTHVVERFKTKEQCEHVLNATKSPNVRTECIQATIYVPEPRLAVTAK